MGNINRIRISTTGGGLSLYSLFNDAAYQMR